MLHLLQASPPSVTLYCLPVETEHGKTAWPMYYLNSAVERLPGQRSKSTEQEQMCCPFLCILSREKKKKKQSNCSENFSFVQAHMKSGDNPGWQFRSQSALWGGTRVLQMVEQCGLSVETVRGGYTGNWQWNNQRSGLPSEFFSTSSTRWSNWSSKSPTLYTVQPHRVWSLAIKLSFCLFFTTVHIHSNLLWGKYCIFHLLTDTKRMAIVTFIS